MISSLIIYMMPIWAAAAGGLFSDLAGVLNIALEALILAGAFAGYAAAVISGSASAAFVAGGAAGLVIALLFALLVLRFKGNIFVAGIGLNLLIPGAVSVLSSRIYGTSGVLHAANFPAPAAAAGIPLYFLYTALLIAGLWLVLNHSAFGLRIRAAGADPHIAEIRGLSTFRIQTAALALSGLMSGFAGALMVLHLESYVPSISSGRGWIALAAIYLGRRTPRGLFFASLLFACAEYGSNVLQGISELPSSLFFSIPYIITFLALILQNAFRPKAVGRRGKHTKTKIFNYRFHK